MLDDLFALVRLLNRYSGSLLQYPQSAVLFETVAGAHQWHTEILGLQASGYQMVSGHHHRCRFISCRNFENHLYKKIMTTA
jgi:hypothetical protein